MREHMAHCSGSLAFIRSEHVVELKCGREQSKKRDSNLFILNRGYSAVKYSEGKELSIVEEFSPRPITVVEYLSCVVAIRDFKVWKRQSLSPQLLGSPMVCGIIIISCCEVDLLSAGPQDEFRVQTMLRRLPGRADCLGDGEFKVTIRADGIRVACRTLLRVETPIASRTVFGGCSISGRK